MATIETDDGVALHVEETGTGAPLVFVHEFAGDWRSWEPQLRHFSRRYRCIAFNARGYPPSDVPAEEAMYSQQRARDDIRCVLDGLAIEQAHVVGLSMGAFATLHFGMEYPGRARSLVVAGCGYGAQPERREQFQSEARTLAREIREQGMAYVANTYGHGPTREPLRIKDPRGFEEFVARFGEHSAAGSANTMLGCQARRPSLYAMRDELARVALPVLIVAGDEDEPALEPSVMLKATLANAALAVLPKSGHMLNIEEPALFNRLLEDFLHTVELGRWPAAPRKDHP